MTAPYFVADSASVTVLRSLASTSFGKYNVTLPDGVDLEDVYEVAAPGNELAYVASLGARRRVGGMFRRFVRADVNVTAQGEDMVPASDVERVLNDAEKRVSGDFFLESDISRAGLGPWVPFVDFQVGDIANVEIWGRVVPLVVTRIEPKRTDHSDNDWSVHVGGQLLSDSEARLAENADIYNAVVSDRRDLAGLDGKIRTETNNRKAAVSAERAARVADVSQVREVLGGARADERSLVSQLAAVQAQIAGMVGYGESPPPPGMLNSYLWMNTRLWQQQDKINRLNDKFQDEVRERERKQDEFAAALARRAVRIYSWDALQDREWTKFDLVQVTSQEGDVTVQALGGWSGTVGIAYRAISGLNDNYTVFDSFRLKPGKSRWRSNHIGTARGGLVFVVPD